MFVVAETDRRGHLGDMRHRVLTHCWKVDRRHDREVDVTEPPRDESESERISLRFVAGVEGTLSSDEPTEAPPLNIPQLMQVLRLVDVIWTRSFLVAAYSPESADDADIAVNRWWMGPPYEYATQFLEGGLRPPEELRQYKFEVPPFQGGLGYPDVPRPTVRLRMQSPLWLELLHPLLIGAGGTTVGVAAFRFAKWAMTHPRDIGGFLPGLVASWHQGWSEADRARSARRVLRWHEPSSVHNVAEPVAGLVTALEASSELAEAAQELDYIGHIQVQGDERSRGWEPPR